MKAAVIAAPRQATLRDVPLPEPGPGEVRVRVEGSGLCGSDLADWEGRPWTRYPLEPGAPGHEGWGVVDAVGDGVRGLEAGNRVTGLLYRAFAEHDVARAEHLVRAPDALRGEPLPSEPLACAFNAFRRSDVRAGQTVAVVGVGFLGAVLTALAAKAGARVVAVTRREDGLRAAARMGASELVPMDDHRKVIERVKEATGGALCDRVLECTGKQWPLDLSGELTRTRGRLVIVGYHVDPRQVNMQLWNWRGLDVVNAHERDPAEYVRGVREAVDALAAGRLDPRPLYTHRVPLDDVSRAFETLEARPEGFMKALVVSR